MPERDDVIEKLNALKETVEAIERQLERGMTAEEQQDAVKKVTQTIELLENFKAGEAVKSARVAEETDDSPFK